jgi:hypothetical protein
MDDGVATNVAANMDDDVAANLLIDWFNNGPIY